ncbi:MAG: VanZ family protein [Fimbriimonadales bacterium]
MKRWFWLVLWLAWVGLYVVFSSRVGSPENSAGWLLNLLQQFAPELAQRLTPETLSILNYIVRKGAHFFGFAILNLLAYWMFRRTFGMERRRALRWAVITSIVRAALDETQQAFVPGRSAMITDVLIDSAGVLLMAWLIQSRWTRRVEVR